MRRHPLNDLKTGDSSPSPSKKARVEDEQTDPQEEDNNAQEEGKAAQVEGKAAQVEGKPAQEEGKDAQEDGKDDKDDDVEMAETKEADDVDMADVTTSDKVATTILNIDKAIRDGKYLARHMPVLGNVHPIKIKKIEIFSWRHFSAHSSFYIINWYRPNTATQEVPMKNIWKKLSVQFLRYAIELLHVKRRTRHKWR